MQISTFLLFTLFFFFFFFSSFKLFRIQGLEPSPVPDSSDVAFWPPSLSPSLTGSPSPDSDEFLPPSPALYRSLTPAPEHGGDDSRGEHSGEIAPSRAPTEDTGSDTVRWCTVRDEFDDCEYFVSLFKQSEGYTWKWDTTQGCLESIKRGEADLINLEAGLAYIAFLNYSMKAIANEVYCDQAKSYLAVAVVSGQACKNNERISLLDFKGKKSCHGGYSTAAGWNYPITHIKTLLAYEKLNDREIAESFFSEVCAPSELEVSGVCNGCGDENGFCPSKSLYFGDSGAFRCLVEEMGDIAFLKADTALLYSMEGPHNQSWSNKSIRDFMYLCPQGGCREINGYPGACSYGSVPANMIMAGNSIATKKKLFVLEALTNVTNEGKASASHQISPSTQGLDAVKMVTRSYLGKSASVSQSIQELNTHNTQAANSSEVNSIPDGSSISSAFHTSGILFMSILSIFIILFSSK
ncbi:inhibitor of carbonic anhydrase-like isoform X2 [Juglans microcarpa x Juglans regia]|uniref:inhibitor of carbonic anhydrase-like isoform X2 n=1 Tax=Juglans microcarpa x Juglans regia TaxID=2249226 RepID=UPI001B7EF4D8|nr:inhibitor of carbonic anhydrase-like isoform X2 [Juglans microcarpa x Juglans regia]